MIPRISDINSPGWEAAALVVALCVLAVVLVEILFYIHGGRRKRKTRIW